MIVRMSAAGKPAPLRTDTSPDALESRFEAFVRMGPDGRVRAALEMSDDLRRLSEDGVRMRHPEYSDQKVWLAAIRIWLGDDLFSRAYPGERVEP
jgi:hypothetical protein